MNKFEEICNLITGVMLFICVYVVPALMLLNLLGNLFNWLSS